MKQLSLFLLLLVALGTHAQPATWNYVFPVADLNGVMDVATGSDGSVYVTGRFTGTLQLGGNLLSSRQPGPCLYIARLSPAGQLLRLTRLEGAADVLPRSIVVDQAGNSYVTGSFSGTLTYNRGQQTTSLQATPANGTVFLLKCSPAGSISWVQQADGGETGSYRSCHGLAVAVDRAGNSYISGEASGDNIRFGPLRLGAHSRDGFVASYDRHGGLRWAQALTHLSPTFGTSTAGNVVVDDAGNGYFSGHSYSGWTLDGIALALPTDTDYLARFDTRQGQLRWARSTPGDGGGQALVLDKMGAVYIGGTFSGTASCGAIPLTSAGDADGYVARYSASGHAQWATSLGGTAYDVVGSLAVDQKARKVFASGMTNYTSQGTNQSFVASLSTTGQLQQTTLVGGPGTSSGSQLALDARNSVYTAGVFTGSCGFGAIVLSTVATQGYLARFGSPLPLSTSPNSNGSLAISIFPMPAREQFTVRLASPDQTGQALLYNHLGCRVAQRSIEPANQGAEAAFDTSALPDGPYVLRLFLSQTTTARLVLVQH